MIEVITAPLDDEVYISQLSVTAKDGSLIPVQSIMNDADGAVHDVGTLFGLKEEGGLFFMVNLMRESYHKCLSHKDKESVRLVSTIGMFNARTLYYLDTKPIKKAIYRYIAGLKRDAQRYQPKVDLRIELTKHASIVESKKMDSSDSYYISLVTNDGRAHKFFGPSESIALAVAYQSLSVNYEGMDKDISEFTISEDGNIDNKFRILNKARQMHPDITSEVWASSTDEGIHTTLCLTGGCMVGTRRATRRWPSPLW